MVKYSTASPCWSFVTHKQHWGCANQPPAALPAGFVQAVQRGRHAQTLVPSRLPRAARRAGPGRRQEEHVSVPGVSPGTSPPRPRPSGERGCWFGLVLVRRHVFRSVHMYIAVPPRLQSAFGL